MASCNYNCPEDDLTHSQVECEDFSAGGINSIGILKCDQTTITDFENATQYDTAITNGDLRLIEEILAQMPAASPVEGSSTSSCGPETRVNTYDREVTFMDYNVSADNILFYDQLNRRKSGIILHVCGSDKVLVQETGVQVSSSLVVPEREGELAHFEVRLYWRSYNSPAMYDAPAGVFAQGAI